MLKRVYVPRKKWLRGGREVGRDVVRKAATMQLRKTYKQVRFVASGKHDELLRWMDFEVYGAGRVG